jgi:hypothetical protein
LITKLALLGYAVSLEGRGSARRIVAVPIMKAKTAPAG